MKIILALLLVSNKPLKVEIVFTSNIYGNFGKSKATWINPDFPPTLGGFESLQEFIKTERENAEKRQVLFLLFDTGNFTGGYITRDNLNVDTTAYFINELKYDAINIGVKELIIFPIKSRGYDFLPKSLTLHGYLSKFNTELVSFNVKFFDFPLMNLIKPYKIIKCNHIKIGVFGLVSENTPFFIYQDENLEPENKPFEITREYESAKEAVEALKREGCDVIVMLSSVGYYRERFIARDVPGIDLILGGFDGFGERQAYVDPVNHTIVLRNYDYLSQVGKIILNIDPIAKTIVSFEYTPITLFEEEFTPLAPSEESEEQE